MDALFPLLVQPVDTITLDILRKGAAKSTMRRYSKTVQSWLVYCQDRGIDAIDAPTDDVLRWLDNELRRINSKTHIYIALSALRMVQRAAQGDREPLPYRTSERPRLEMFIASRIKEASPVKKVSPILLSDLASMVRACAWRGLFPRQGVNLDRAHLLAVRDAALLTVLWWGALRADDLTRGWIECTHEGLRITLPDSKTGPAVVGICPAQFAPPYENLCAVKAWERYQAIAWGTTGFDLTVLQVSRTVRLYARLAGLRGRYTGHSMRSGFATECARQSVPDRLVRAHARWTGTKTHEGYVRGGRLFLDSPTRLLTVADLPVVVEPRASLPPSVAPSGSGDIAPATLGLFPAKD